MRSDCTVATVARERRLMEYSSLLNSAIVWRVSVPGDRTHTLATLAGGRVGSSVVGGHATAPVRASVDRRRRRRRRRRKRDKWSSSASVMGAILVAGGRPSVAVAMAAAAAAQLPIFCAANCRFVLGRPLVCSRALVHRKMR